MFFQATKFNGDLSKWDVGAVKSMSSSTLQSDLPSKRSTILTMFLLFSLFNFCHSFLFYKCIANAQQILTFDLCSLFHFLVFQHADAFNGNVSTWNVGAVENMRESTFNLISLQKDLLF